MLHRTTRHGFTLIELMIAVTLGMLLVYTAIAGFRVASQCNTLANRLSIENCFIRAGFVEAHNQLDFWTQVDDPDDPAKQGLRSTVAMGTNGVGWHLTRVPMSTTVGLPFTPMSLVFPANKRLRDGFALGTSKVPRFAPVDGRGPTIPQAPYLPLDTTTPPSPTTWPANGDEDCGFDPSYAWSPHDPRTWYRGNCIEKARTSNVFSANIPSLWMGRYSLFMNSEGTEGGSTLAYTPFDKVRPDYRIPPASPPTDEYQASYTPVTGLPPHRWYSRQILGLSRALGFYGMCDYLPSNVLYNACVPPGNGVSKGGLPSYFQPNNFFIGSGMNAIPTLGLYALTVTQSYGVIDPTAIAAGQPLAGAHYSLYNSDYTASGGSGAARLQQFMNLMMPLKPWATTLPENWPQLAVGVARYIKSAKFVGIARIRWTDPLNGNTSELSFTGVGSSLRGARMQRKPTSGWADWDNAPGAINDANLDTP